LRDATYDGLIEESPDSFRVNSVVYTDPSLFDVEDERVIRQSWNYVGHVSELPNPGDYRTSAVGSCPIVLTRDEHGAIHALVNVCRHRGNSICRMDYGHANVLRCSYHGWTYSNSGELLGVPQRSAYPANFAPRMKDLGLHKLRCEIYAGLIFATLNQDAESIEDYLGEVRPYVDLWAKLSPGGLPTVTRPHAYLYPGNWKFQAENGVDGYHAQFVHESAFTVFAQYSVGGDYSNLHQQPGCTRAFRNGHSILERPGFRSGLSPEDTEAYIDAIRSESPAEVDDVVATRHIFIFPNLTLMDANIRVIQPTAVDQTAVYSYFFDIPGLPREVNEARLQEYERRLGTTGMVGSDDVEIFAGSQSALRGHPDWLLFERGLSRPDESELPAQEGRAADELPQRSLYRQWRRLMTESGAPSRPDQTAGAASV
jgi:benzoate/toluate 1,2-dioxygenase alpha subunit